MNKVTSPKKKCRSTTTSLKAEKSTRPSPNVNISSDVPIAEPAAYFPKPTYKGVLINKVLVGLRYIPANGIYQHDKIDTMDTCLTGDIPSEMLYIEVGEDCGEGGGGYEKIKVIRMISVRQKVFLGKHGRLGKVE